MRSGVSHPRVEAIDGGCDFKLSYYNWKMQILCSCNSCNTMQHRSWPAFAQITGCSKAIVECTLWRKGVHQFDGMQSLAPGPESGYPRSWKVLLQLRLSIWAYGTWFNGSCMTRIRHSSWASWLQQCPVAALQFMKNLKVFTISPNLEGLTPKPFLESPVCQDTCTDKVRAETLAQGVQDMQKSINEDSTGCIIFCLKKGRDHCHHCIQGIQGLVYS